MDSRSFGIAVILFGVAVLVTGVLIFTGGLGWFGRLPGDIRIKSDGTRIYIPVTSMIVVSAALTVLVNVLRRLL